MTSLHQGGWSGSTATADTAQEQPPQSPGNKSFNQTPEVTTIVLAFAAVGGIMGVLAHFNNRSLSDWPYYVTLNALIALLAAESRAPLADMEAFDEASRGTWGALKLLATARGGHTSSFLGSFAAVIIIFTLALGPFAQQIVTYRTRSVMIESFGSATVARAVNYTAALPGKTTPTGYVPILSLESAVYNGLFAEYGGPKAALKFEYQTGNYRWPSFETVGVCHEYVDPVDVFSMTPLIPSANGEMPHSTIIKLIFMGTEAKNGRVGELKPRAQLCALSAYLQTIDATVVNGVLSENVTTRVVNQTVVNMTKQEEDADLAAYITGADNTTYPVGKEAIFGMRGWFSSISAPGSAVRTATNFSRTITDNSVVVNLTVGISSSNYHQYQNDDGIDMLMTDMATSMTVAFRSFMGAVPVSGQAISTESFVHVRWGFAVLPIVVVAAAALFLMAAIYRTRQSDTKLLKSSALAMLLNGLDEDVRSQFRTVASLENKKRQARAVMVQLDESNGESLLRG
ncbi:hypothetical protein BKA67DRAFT_594282 [Truncatella angustata]|uniref:Uncharacterized protein n=1 Tax=Truncatella angustata TaxID=152316 RepID=A0A9P8UFE7_9PEZI|nr:uncharacterized protein BKA67DRAFT_594282 [Truncatella angustata]KAH6648926.1 hypothetical protein BKA67DRAFT_594282 [Truncatella angustata]